MLFDAYQKASMYSVSYIVLSCICLKGVFMQSVLPSLLQNASFH